MFLLVDKQNNNRILMCSDRKYGCQYFAQQYLVFNTTDLDMRKRILNRTPQKAWIQFGENVFEIQEVKFFDSKIMNCYTSHNYLDNTSFNQSQRSLYDNGKRTNRKSVY